MKRSLENLLLSTILFLLLVPMVYVLGMSTLVICSAVSKIFK